MLFNLLIIYDIPKSYAVDDIDYCLSSLDNKVNSSFASGTDWNITVSGDNCIFMNWGPIVDGGVYDSSGHIGPYTFGDNTTNVINILGDHPSNDNEYKGFVDWSLVPIKIGVNVTDTIFIMNLSSIADTFHFHNLTKNPLSSTAEEIFDDINAGTEYYSSNFGGSGGVKTIDLGTTADSELSTIRNNSGVRFGVGVHAFIQQSWSNIHSSEAPGNDQQLLKVTYVRIPSDTPDFSTITLTAQSTSLYTTQNNLFTAYYSYGGSGISGLIITFQRSSDNVSWTNILNQTTDSLGYSQINYAQDEAGTWYFRSYYPEGSYPTKTSSSLSIEYLQMPGSSTPGQQPGDNSGQVPSNGDGGPLGIIINPIMDLWCFLVSCPDDQDMDIISIPPGEEDLPGEISPDDIPIDREILSRGTSGYIPYDDVNPIIKPLVDLFMVVSGERRTLIDTPEGIIEAIPEIIANISWGLLLSMFALIIAIAIFGRRQGILRGA